MVRIVSDAKNDGRCAAPDVCTGIQRMTTNNHQPWPAYLHRHTQLRALAPADGALRAFYGGYYLFQLGDDAYTVVATTSGHRFGPHAMSEIVDCYPGFGDTAAMLVTPDLEAQLRARRR